MSFLYHFHSGFRWLVLTLGLLGLAVSFMQMTSPSRKPLVDRLSLIFVAALDIQLLLGITLAVVIGTWASEVVLHGVIMAFAVILAHVLRGMAKKMPSGRLLIYRFLAPVAIILAGHMLLVSRP